MFHSSACGKPPIIQLKTNIVFESDTVEPIDAIARKLKANNDETTKMSVKFALSTSRWDAIRIKAIASRMIPHYRTFDLKLSRTFMLLLGFSLPQEIIEMAAIPMLPTYQRIINAMSILANVRNFFHPSFHH